jgi:hypothetical protein
LLDSLIKSLDIAMILKLILINLFIFILVFVLFRVLCSSWIPDQNLANDRRCLFNKETAAIVEELVSLDCNSMGSNLETNLLIRLPETN